MEVVASLSQGRTAAAQCGLFTHKLVAAIFEPPCIMRAIKSVGCGSVPSLREEKLSVSFWSDKWTEGNCFKIIGTDRKIILK